MKKVLLRYAVVLGVAVGACMFVSCTQLGPSIKINWIDGKPAEQPPLVGVAIEKGMEIAGKNNVLLIRFSQRPDILSVHPHPGSDGNKIIIDKKKNRLYLFKGGELYKTYPVATGKNPAYTPEGNFKIAIKIKDTSDQLDEQLGPRWLGLSVPYHRDNRARQDDRAPRGHKYGIHGTNEPSSIGRHASGGCIRMKNEDVVELYELVEEGTPVEIK